MSNCLLIYVHIYRLTHQSVSVSANWCGQALVGTKVAKIVLQFVNHSVVVCQMYGMISDFSRWNSNQFSRIHRKNDSDAFVSNVFSWTLSWYVLGCGSIFLSNPKTTKVPNLISWVPCDWTTIWIPDFQEPRNNQWVYHDFLEFLISLHIFPCPWVFVWSPHAFFSLLSLISSSRAALIEPWWVSAEGNSEGSLGKVWKLWEGLRRIWGSARVCGRQSTLNCTDLQTFVNDHSILDITMWFRMYRLPGL